MFVRYYRLVLGVFFLLAGVGLLVLRFGAPETVAKFDPIRIFLGAIFALVLGCWNLMKWYAQMMDFQQRATPVRQPLQRDPDAVKEEAPNPEFDFSKKDEKSE